MRILFIELGVPRPGIEWTTWVDDRNRFAMPPVGAVSVLSHSRPHDEIIFCDEKVSPLPDPIDADLVAISFKTMESRRAYRLADEIRARGIPVVLGGIHASLLPREAKTHADAVVAGEGESVWRQLLDDFEAGRPQPFYRATQAVLHDLPPQRQDVLNHSGYMVHGLQSARGCSFDCEFCPTKKIFGAGFRLRDVDAVIEEVEALRAIEDKPVFFSENVFGAGNLEFIARLTKELKRRQVQYGVICDWFMLKEETVRLLDEGGCGLVCVNTTGREEPKEVAALEAFHKVGIPIWGYFMFGFEEDGPDVFERAIERVRKYDIVTATLTVLTPFPGTPMATRLAGEGRIFSYDLDRYDHCHVHFEPKQMSAEQLEQGYQHVCTELEDRLPFANALETFSR